MSRQHATPLLLGPDGAVPLVPLPRGAGPEQISEATLQQLLHDHPGCLPIAEVDPLFAGAVPICTELNTGVGRIDNLLVTPSGLPVLVECKLWRNPEQRREVVGQILEYAKALTHWTVSDLQREVARRVPGNGNPILHRLLAAGHDVDEIAFNDALMHNLRRSRFLLLIVGDGIREGVEAIAEYLQVHAGLHFSFGLIELPVYVDGSGRRLIVPRVLAKTVLITRTVVTVQDGQTVVDADEGIAEPTVDDDPLSPVNFWTAFIAGLRFDDPEQPLPRPSRQGYVTVTLAVPGGNLWLTIWRNEAKGKVGVYLSYTRDTIGARVVERIVADWSVVRDELGGTVALTTDKLGRQLIEDERSTGSWRQTDERDRVFSWLRRRTNDFVNVLRPRVKTILTDVNGVA